jgi:DNA-binding CsgD family transcriptional regulator
MAVLVGSEHGHAEPWMIAEAGIALDLGQEIGAVAKVAPGTTLSLRVGRRSTRAAFTSADAAALDSVVPHLANIGAIMQRRNAAERRNVAIATVLDKVSIAVVAVDGECRHGLANQAARELNRQGAIVLAPDRLRLAHAEDTARLHRAVAGLLAEVAAGARPAPVELTARRDGGRSIILRIVPLAELASLAQRKATQDEPLALVYALDPDADYEPTPRILHRLYGLTAAEAELVIGLSAGLRLVDVAARRRTTKGTARVQIKSVFRKTGAADQAQLMSIMAHNPILALHRQALGRRNEAR